MKRLYYVYICVVLFALVLSCKKDVIDTNTNNTVAPIARAGDDIILTLPVNSTTLDGTASRDPNGIIVYYLWNKVSGPESFLIEKNSAVVTQVKNLEEGIYLFELSVTDREGLMAKDTIQITVRGANNLPGSVQLSLYEVGTINATGMYSAVSTPNKILFIIQNHFQQAEIHILDIKTGQWSITKTPHAAIGMAIVINGNKVYFGGGNYSDELPQNLDIYDVVANTWTTTTIPEGRTSMGAGAVGDKVLFAAGVNDGLWGISSDVDIYNINSGKWTKSAIATIKFGMEVVTAGNKVYFAGGSGGDGLYSVDIYNNDDGTFYQRSFKELYGMVSGLAVNDKIYWAGVDNAGSKGKAEVWSTNSGEIAVYPLSYARTFPSVVTKNGYILIGTPASHSVSPYNFNQYSNMVDIYNTNNGEWKVGILPFSIQNAAFISLNNTIYMAGGKLNNGEFNNKVYRLSW